MSGRAEVAKSLGVTKSRAEKWGQKQLQGRLNKENGCNGCYKDEVTWKEVITMVKYTLEEATIRSKCVQSAG